jgi:hypothetical protein
MLAAAKMIDRYDGHRGKAGGWTSNSRQPPPVANYVPAVTRGREPIISGQLCLFLSGKLDDAQRSKHGEAAGFEASQTAPRLCATSLHAQ